MVLIDLIASQVGQMIEFSVDLGLPESDWSSLRVEP